MSNKCDNCNKNILKSAPGIECGRCERIVHLNTKCTGLSNKQIAAVKAAPSLEWTCLECQKDTPRRNSSIIVPEEEEGDEDNTTVEINARKLLSDISKEVEKAVKKELKELNESLHFHSAKLDEVVECMEVFKKTIKDLERKNITLTNKNTNLEIRVGALEQRIEEIEQEKLATVIEIANVPVESNSDMNQVVDNVANMLEQSRNNIKSSRSIYGRKDQPPKIIVELKDEETKEKWITAGKSQKITVDKVHPTHKNNNTLVYVREAMTKHNKQLFWNTKQELKINLNYKYVWFRRGFVRARKDDHEKPHIIRNMDDLYTLSGKNSA